jgi:glycosyltransferase involved in cell wall biosynthesis
MKKILVINSASLFPTTMMSQRRAISQILSLSKSDNLAVDVLTFYKNEEQRKSSEDGFNDKVNKFYNLPAINHDGNKWRKNLTNLQIQLKYYFLGHRTDVSKYSSNYYIHSINKIIDKEKYDVVISHYWFGSFFLQGKTKHKPIIMIDIHALVEEDIALNNNGLFFTNNHQLEIKKLGNSLKFQKELFKFCDYLIPNAASQIKILKENYPENKFIYCPNGQDLEQFRQKMSPQYDSNTVLFYGSLGGKQNISAFDIFFKNVWPLILEKKPDSKLLILGNNPSGQIKQLHNGKNITVTGYVEDVTDYISKACCMVLPMNLGVGFRGRVVEVMASGVPVIGNHNALDCIGIENEVNGFITDDFNLMAEYAIKLMSDKPYRKQLSENSLEFVLSNYTVENTYGKLADYISSF